jgi:hypothetical protein
VPAGESDYEGVPYDDLVFEDVDWSEVGDHDPARRSRRKGNAEKDVHAEWATQACQDDDRWVRAAGSQSGLTIKVTGFAPSAGFVVTVVLAPKEHPPQGRWWGATAWAAKRSEIKQYEEGR